MVTTLQTPVSVCFRLPSSHEPDRAEAVFCCLEERQNLTGHDLMDWDTHTEEHFLHQEKVIEFYRKQVLCVPNLCIVCTFILFSVIP
jgi:hypothetical protein